MKTLNIGDKEYVLEFSFQAAKHKQLINKMFKMLSCSYLGYAILVREEFSCLEFIMNRDTINWILK